MNERRKTNKKKTVRWEKHREKERLLQEKNRVKRNERDEENFFEKENL